MIIIYKNKVVCNVSRGEVEDGNFNKCRYTDYWLFTHDPLF